MKKSIVIMILGFTIGIASAFTLKPNPAESGKLLSVQLYKKTSVDPLICIALLCDVVPHWPIICTDLYINPQCTVLNTDQRLRRQEFYQNHGLTIW